ncbi:MAG: PDZ domain-containing protein [Verrucomicrobiales bacterium]
MKSLPLLKLFCLTVLAPALTATGRAADEKGVQEAASPSASATSAAGKGRITVTIDKDGKTETRVIELNTDDPAKAGAAIAEALKDTGNKEQTPLKESENPTYLGIMLDEVPRAGFAELPIDKGTGLLVIGVSKESPAAKAGIQKGDILARLDQQILVSPQQLIVLVRNKNAGDKVRLTFFREGKQQEAEVTLARGNPDELAQGHGADRGPGKPKLDWLQKLDDQGARRLLKSKLFRVGPDGNVREEKAEGGEPLPWRRWFGDGGPNEEVRKELEASRKKIAEELGRVQKDVAEEMHGALAKIRAETAKLQEECRKLQHELMERVSVELKRAQEAAHKAQETAQQAAEEAKKRAESADKNNP